MEHAQFSTSSIAVALSGGADSLYTLLHLHDAGIPVMGVHGLFAQRIPGYMGMAAATISNEAQHIEHALQHICTSLGVPFLVVDATKAFAQHVVQPFVASYGCGETPNPCALCNAHIKFGMFADAAVQAGAGVIATGHYARLVHGKHLPAELAAWLYTQRDPVALQMFTAQSCFLADTQGRPVTQCTPEEAGGVLLLQGAEPRKEQSYFLSLVPVRALQRAVFPLGLERKALVEERLAQLGYTPPQQEESQEVCFVPNDDYRSFVQMAAPSLGVTLGCPGDIVLQDGTRLGQHKGLWQYTEGQRKGLGVCWKEPLYVVEKDRVENVLRLGAWQDMRIEGCYCHGVNVLVPENFWPETIYVKTRYREEPKKGRAQLVRNGAELRLEITFLESENMIAPGQIATILAPVHGVFETDGRPVFCVLAGGILAG